MSAPLFPHLRGSLAPAPAPMKMPEAWATCITLDGSVHIGRFTIPGVTLVFDELSGNVYPLANVVSLSDPLS